MIGSYVNIRGLRTPEGYWASEHSKQLATQSSSLVAVKVINHLGGEVLKVFRV